MEELIARQIKDKTPEEVSTSNLSFIVLFLFMLMLQVTELVLDNARCSEVSGLSDKFVNLNRLSIVNAGLVSLDGFPSLPNLKEVCVTLQLHSLVHADVTITGSTRR